MTVQALTREQADMHFGAGNIGPVSGGDLYEAEMAIVGLMMVDNSFIEDVPFEEPDFHWQLHRDVFAYTHRIISNGEIANAATIMPYLPKVLPGHGEGPTQYLISLTKAGISAKARGQIAPSLQLIRKASSLRRLSNIGHHIHSVADEGHDLLVLETEIEAIRDELENLRITLREKDNGTSAGAAYRAQLESAANKNGAEGVPVCLPEIARVLSEPVFEAGNLYGLLSSSGEGKSSLTMQQVYHALKNDCPVQFLSYDQNAAQCVRQMIAQVHGIEVRRQRDPMKLLSSTEQDLCYEFSRWIDRAPLEIIRCQREGVSQLNAYSRRFVKKFKGGNTPLIVTDHIGKVKPRDPKLSADRISGEVSVECKALADETGAAYLMLNQRNSFGTRRDNPRPIAADLYGGEGARADYDAVLYLYRAEKYKAEREKIAATDSDWKKINKVFAANVEGVAEIGAIKVRFGDPTITEELKFEAKFTRYTSAKRAEPQERML